MFDLVTAFKKILYEFSHRYPSDNSSKLDLQFLQNPTPNNKYKVITAYGASKLCNLLFALEFNRRYVEDGIYCNAVHPGNILPTNLVRNAGMMYRTAFTLAKLFTKSLVSQQSIHCIQVIFLYHVSSSILSDV